ncbi:MAG: isochorismatase family protein [Oscillospiraceae bacterium]|nr:isochorismatase family protein [Oscillospiraceae bacterium]
MKILVAIDLQVDFTTGVLGNEQCVEAAAKSAEYIKSFREDKESRIFCTLDTHNFDYLNTQEGRNLPIAHCIVNTEGWKIDPIVGEALGGDYFPVQKGAFGSEELPSIIRRYTAGNIEEIVMIGVCTDICVISNAMILKAAFPEVPIKVISECCAGTTPESHALALKAMSACQIIIE